MDDLVLDLELCISLLELVWVPCDPAIHQERPDEVFFGKDGVRAEQILVADAARGRRPEVQPLLDGDERRRVGELVQLDPSAPPDASSAVRSASSVAYGARTGSSPRKEPWRRERRRKSTEFGFSWNESTDLSFPGTHAGGPARLNELAVFGATGAASTQADLESVTFDRASVAFDPGR
jgi:hypothetical protein